MAGFDDTVMTLDDIAFDDAAAGKEDLEAGRYLVKLARIEPTSHAQYGKGRKWVFEVAHHGENGNPPSRIYNQDGKPYELWQFTGTDLTPNGKARKWATALLGREIKDGDSGREIAEALIGSKGNALIGRNDKSGRSAILQLDTYRNGASSAPTTQAAPQPAVIAKVAPPGPTAESLLTPEERGPVSDDF